MKKFEIGQHSTVFYSELKIPGLCRNTQSKAKRSSGFHPSSYGSPDVINPNRCAVIIAHSRGGMGDKALPPPLLYLHLEFISMEKEFCRANSRLIFAKQSQCPSIGYTLCDNPNFKKKTV